MPGVLDADTHIAESAAMWGFIDKEMYPRAREDVPLHVVEKTLCENARQLYASRE